MPDSCRDIPALKLQWLRDYLDYRRGHRDLGILLGRKPEDPVRRDPAGPAFWCAAMLRALSFWDAYATMREIGGRCCLFRQSDPN